MTNIYLYFIDYTKVFDKVQPEELFKMLGKLDLFGKYIGIKQNILLRAPHAFG